MRTAAMDDYFFNEIKSHPEAAKRPPVTNARRLTGRFNFFVPRV